MPIWVSGTVNKNVAKRIARFGSGWIPWGDAAADIKTGIAQMRELVAAAGGDLTGMSVAGNLPTVKDADGKPDLARTIDGAPALVEAGVTDVRSSFPIPADSSAAQDTLGELVGAFRKAVGRTD